MSEYKNFKIPPKTYKTFLGNETETESIPNIFWDTMPNILFKSNQNAKRTIKIIIPFS